LSSHRKGELVRLGIIGLPASGKTTVFNIITGGDFSVGEFVGGQRTTVQTAVVDVPDPRVDALRDLLRPQKTTFAKINLADIGGMQVKAGRLGLPGLLVNELGTIDGIIHVVRAFEDENVPHVLESVDPQRDINALETEFLLNDLMVAERRLERLSEEYQKGARDRSEIDRERTLFERLLETLNEEKPLRCLSFSPEEERLLSGFGLISRKSLLIVINMTEDHRELKVDVPQEGVDSICLQGKIEMEINQLPHEEAQIFLDEYGIETPGRERILQACCHLLQTITFYTFNENELRAWTLKRGATALDAAAAIHTDIARGFIRAEIIDWDELIASGGMSQARTSGKLRVEGKDHPVSDGEMIYIRFNI
jgi:GTP-binding protein YchF